MDDTPGLRDRMGWRLAVWGLRVIGPGLAIVVIGLIGLLWSTGSGLTILAVGMVIYLIGVVITVAGIAVIYRQASPERPNFIELRWTLLHDAVCARGPGADPLESFRRPLAESSGVAALRADPHWRPAVWGLRAIGPGIVLIAAGLITLSGSTATGRVIVAVGAAIYAIGLVVSMVEARRAYGALPAPRLDYARVHRVLVHDALHARP